MDVQAIARLVVLKMGAGVLPHHLVSQLQEEGHLIHIYKGCGKPLLNSIQIAYLKERSQIPAAEELIRFLSSELKALKREASSRNLK
jgi:DNA-binding transcriptional LysR family regulator